MLLGVLRGHGSIQKTELMAGKFLVGGEPRRSDSVEAPGDYLHGERGWAGATTATRNGLWVAIASSGLGHVRR